MIVELDNGLFSARIDSLGAEMKSLFQRSAAAEYMWGGDAFWWSGSAPILFPIVGGLKGGRYRYEGREYALGQHGFARKMEFEPRRRAADLAELTLSSNAETRAVYPFEFRLTAAFRLTRSGIAVDYEVANGSGSPMFFSIGSHPAFRVPFAGGSLENYYLHFDEPEGEELPRWYFRDGLILDDPAPGPGANGFGNSRQIFFDRTLFDGGPLIYRSPVSREFTLMNSRNSRRLKMVTEGVPALAVWSKPGGAPFVCLEPWHGLPDSPSCDGDLTRKPGILRLEAAGVFRTGYRVEIQPA